jgi:hypothetical protein
MRLPWPAFLPLARAGAFSQGGTFLMQTDLATIIRWTTTVPARAAKPTRPYDSEHHAAADHANPNALQTGHRLSCINATHRPHA